MHASYAVKPAYLKNYLLLYFKTIQPIIFESMCYKWTEENLRNTQKTSLPSYKLKYNPAQSIILLHI